ncbi:thermophilic desulfurizing enzyme family protein [Moelleriella libera RCEF 2490]|uniref:Thermophilic desulfurizing enzyme family protein n=1 Tax=Moelleriella libera RCEF 2490 TaxID=1081109 RepID=A0A166NYD5_9HYPO|nr:thermophilic desulfurizing enzyme family protein [Moelleriella libera RCEF 2490]
MLLGHHLLWSRIGDVVGSIEQAERLHELILINNYYVGAAVNPRDNDLRIASGGADDDGDDHNHDHSIVFICFKHFTTGGAVSDLLILEGSYEATSERAHLCRRQDGPARRAVCARLGQRRPAPHRVGQRQD